MFNTTVEVCNFFLASCTGHEAQGSLSIDTLMLLCMCMT